MTVLEQNRELSEISAPPIEQVRKWLAAGTEVHPGIFKTPGVCGGDACAGRSRIPVGGLVEWQRLGLNDKQILDAFPSLTLADLKNAWNYAELNPDEIERQIEDNNRDDDE